VIGTPDRFHCGTQIASYIGLVPEEKSSGDRDTYDPAVRSGVPKTLQGLSGSQSDASEPHTLMLS
jgi:hypothetical protein